MTDEEAMKNFPVFRVHETLKLPDDFDMYPGRIIHVDNPTQIVSTPFTWTPMSQGEMGFRRALRQINEE